MTPPGPTTFVDAPESRLRAGVARADVTPPVGIYHRMWGAAAHDRSAGAHKPLLATALHLAPLDGSADGLTAVALDHCLLWPGEMAELLDRAGRRAGVDPERVVVFFSHTHGAGLMGRERVALPGGELIPAYLDQLADTVGDLIRQARESAEPATVTYGRGRCDLAANRDFQDADGRGVCGFNPARGADDAVLVARLTRADGRPLAVVVNYACHPTTLAYENTLISPDYVGALRELVEPAAGAPVVFVQGASGDLGPRHGYVGDVEIADRNGRQLGYAVLSTLEAMPPPGTRFHYSGPVVSGATLGRWDYVPSPPGRVAETAVWREQAVEVVLPYRADLVRGDEWRRQQAHWQAEEQAATARGDAAAAREARAMAERAGRRVTLTAHLPAGPAYPFRTTVFRLGDAVWVPLEGEHYSVLQARLRERFPRLAVVVGTIANGSRVWYLPDADSYGRGLYQEEASVVARGSLEALTEALTAAIRTLTAD